MSDAELTDADKIKLDARRQYELLQSSPIMGECKMTNNPYGNRGDDVMALWALANQAPDRYVQELERRVRMWRRAAIVLFIAGTFQWLAYLFK